MPHFAVDDLHDEQWLAKAQGAAARHRLQHLCVGDLPQGVLLDPGLGNIRAPRGNYTGVSWPSYNLVALLNRHYDCVGYSLLKVDDSIDGGQILTQGSYQLEPGEDYRTWPFVGHKAILRALPEIETALDRLAVARSFTPLPQAARQSQYYTWMRLSKYLRINKAYGAS